MVVAVVAVVAVAAAVAAAPPTAVGTARPLTARPPRLAAARRVAVLGGVSRGGAGVAVGGAAVPTPRPAAARPRHGEPRGWVLL